MNSNTGNAQTYEAGDQRTCKHDNVAPNRYDAGQPNSHSNLDSKDQRSLSNRIASVSKAERENANGTTERLDPLVLAQAHGNEPSRGAKVDAELQAEDEEYLKQKGRI